MADSVANTVRLGIIGLGQQGGMYAKIISGGMVPHVALGAVCDTSEEKRQLARSTYPDVPVYADYLEVIHSGDVDAIVTTVPHYLHPDMGIAALERGVHAIGKKVVEEAAEAWMAAEYEGSERAAEEIAQLLYQAQVLMLACDLKLADVYRHL